MDIVTLGAALNGSAEYVNSHFKGGSNIQIVDNPDGTQTINASGEVSSEDTVARADIAAIKDGETIDSFGDVETALATKANTSTTYTKTEVDTALDDKVDKETGKRLSTNDYTTAEKTKLAGIAEGAEVNVQSNWTQTTTTADDYIKNKPTLGTAAAKNATDTYNATGTDVTTGKAVAEALATLPEPMVFKGSLGTGGTITTLPSASSSNKGYVYKVITAGTYASQSAKAGDTFISDGSAWVLIPSGDEPSGTVTNVAVANGGGLTVSGSPITTSGTITVGHSNSVTAETSSSVKKFTYDANGHVTGSSELSTAESNALASGINSTKVAQIETNENNILLNWGGAKNLTTITGGTTKVANRYIINNQPLSLVAGDYVVSFKTTATTGANAITIFDSNANTVGTATIVNATGTVYGDITITANSANIYVYATVPETITEFMICTKTDWEKSPMYAPYAMSNTELTTAEKQNENNISLVLNADGQKNKWDFANAPSGVMQNVIINKQADSLTITSNGMWAHIIYGCQNIPAGEYVLQCEIADYSATTQTCQIGHEANITTLTPVTGNGKITHTFTKSTDSTTVQNIYFYANWSGTSNTSNTYKVTKIMICEKSLYDISSSHQNYAMTNAELTAAIQALQAQIANQ